MPPYIIQPDPNGRYSKKKMLRPSLRYTKGEMRLLYSAITTLFIASFVIIVLLANEFVQANSSFVPYTPTIAPAMTAPAATDTPTAAPASFPQNNPNPTIAPTPTTPIMTPSPVTTPTLPPQSFQPPIATPTVAPIPMATPTVAPSPTATPTAAPIPTATPTVAPIPTATPTAAPSPTATPGLG